MREKAAYDKAKRTGKKVVKREIRAGSRPGLFYGYPLGGSDKGYMGDLYDTREWDESVPLWDVRYEFE